MARIAETSIGSGEKKTSTPPGTSAARPPPYPARTTVSGSSGDRMYDSDSSSWSL